MLTYVIKVYRHGYGGGLKIFFAYLCLSILSLEFLSLSPTVLMHIFNWKSDTCERYIDTKKSTSV